MDFEKALADPAAVFANPEAVLANPELSREQKLEILRRWEHDARLLQIADEENMPAGEPVALEQIRRALHELGFWPDPNRGGPSKLGGQR